MCLGCLIESIEQDGPVTVTGDHLSVHRLIEKLHAQPWGAVGGPLHVVVDDNNVDDHFLTPENVAESTWLWLQAWGPDAAGFDHDGYALVRDIASGLAWLPTEADRNVAIDLDMLGMPPAGTMVLPALGAGICFGSAWQR